MNFKTTECAENADSFMTLMAINETTECADFIDTNGYE